MKRHVNRPPRKLCEELARKHAARGGVTYEDLLFSKSYRATRVRDELWADIIATTKCSMAALGDAWGIEARVIQQAMKRHGERATC